MNLRTFLRSLIASVGALFVAKLPKKPEYRFVHMGGSQSYWSEEYDFETSGGIDPAFNGDWVTTFSHPSSAELLRARANYTEAIDRAFDEKLRSFLAFRPPRGA